MLPLIVKLFQMSCQRGNNSRTRKQKYQNSTSFKNDLYDTSQTIKHINSIEHKGLCEHCRDILQWKVHFRKYKPLTQPKKWFELKVFFSAKKNQRKLSKFLFFSVRCLQRNILRAYNIICDGCAEKEELCCKCGEKQQAPIE